MVIAVGVVACLGGVAIGWLLSRHRWGRQRRSAGIAGLPTGPDQQEDAAQTGDPWWLGVLRQALFSLGVAVVILGDGLSTNLRVALGGLLGGYVSVYVAQARDPVGGPSRLGRNGPRLGPLDAQRVLVFVIAAFLASGARHLGVFSGGDNTLASEMFGHMSEHDQSEAQRAFAELGAVEDTYAELLDVADRNDTAGVRRAVDEMGRQLIPAERDIHALSNAKARNTLGRYAGALQRAQSAWNFFTDSLEGGSNVSTQKRLSASTRAAEDALSRQHQELLDEEFAVATPQQRQALKRHSDDF